MTIDKHEGSSDSTMCVEECFRRGSKAIVWLVHCRYEGRPSDKTTLVASIGPLKFSSKRIVLHSKSRTRSASSDELQTIECVYAVELPHVMRAVKLTFCHGPNLSARVSYILSWNEGQRIVRGHDARICNAFEDNAYPQWFKQRKATFEELERQKRRLFDIEPLISIVTPVYKTPPDFLRAVIDSVCAQSYAKWEYVLVNASPDDADVSEVLASYEDARIKIVDQPFNDGIVGNTNIGIASSTGDFVAFLDHDDMLEPDALYAYVNYLNQHPATDVFYCDEDSIDEQGTLCNPLFKPDFNRDLLYSNAYFLHFLMVSRGVIEKTERAKKDVEGAQDFDLFLRATEVTQAVAHVPRVLYHWRIHTGSLNTGNSDSKPYAQQSGANALAQYFARCGVLANVDMEDDPFAYRVAFLLSDSTPLLSIIACARDVAECDAALSMFRAIDYSPREMIVVCPEQNRRETGDVDERVNFLLWNGPVDEALMRNCGARQARGEFFFFVDASLMPASDGATRTALGYLQRPEVGVVGPRLLYPDGLVRHMGIVLRRDGGFTSIGENLPADDIGYIGRCHKPSDWSAIGADCQFYRAQDFLELGGYGEGYKTLEYASIDLCLRLRQAGKLAVYTPYAMFSTREYVICHTEGHRNDEESFDADKDTLCRNWGELLSRGDPYYNPNLDSTSPYFKLAE